MPLSDLLVERRSEILNRFVAELREVNDTSGIKSSILIDHLPRFLDEVVSALQRDTRHVLDASASSRAHGEQRFRVGFDLASIVHEYELLRGIIVRVLEDAEAALFLQEFEILSRCFNVGVAEAITEFTRHRDAELRAAIRAREEVLALVAHDLGQPLTHIKGTLQALRKAMVGGSVDAVAFARHLRELERSSKKMESVVRSLVEISLIEAGNLPLTPSDESLTSLLHAATEAAGTHAEEKDIVLMTELVGEETIVVCDRERVLQILGNLIENAVRYTPAKGVVTVRAGHEEAGAWFTVRDTGPGISAEQLPHIFERIFRAPDPRSGLEGAGVGLAVAKGLVRLHGGRIWVETKLGEGATFHFTLPGQAAR